VILMDVQMPNLDGLAATREICARKPPGQRPWIIGMTANAMAEDRRMCLEAGMDDYLAKPVLMPKLVAALEGVVRRKPASSDPEPEPGPAAPGEPGDLTQDLRSARATLMALADNNPRQFVVCRDLLLRSLGESRAGVEVAFQTGDRAKLRFHAHTLKGAALSAGMSEVGRLVGRIEAEAGTVTSLHELGAGLEQLQTYLDQVRQRLDEPANDAA
jgi:HPt (histidine-containing phosphotransfer) domain-containing protein